MSLRQEKTTRRPRSGGVDRRGQISRYRQYSFAPSGNRRPSEVRHPESDLIKDKTSASLAGTLVERPSGYLMLVKINDPGAASAFEGFRAALNAMHAGHVQEHDLRPGT